MRKRLFLPLALSVSGLVLAACGVDPGAGNTPTPGSTGTPTPHGTPTPTPAPGVTPTPTNGGPLDAQCISTLAYATEPIRVVIGEGKVPTAYDGINVGGCDFTKPITKLTIVLEGPGGRQTVEVPFATPVTNVGFPLPAEIDVPVVDAGLTPGEYTRTVTAHTADGDSKELEGFQPIKLVRVDTDAQADLDPAKAWWAEHGPASYTYIGQWQCFCMTDWTAQVLVEVRNGEVVSVRFADTGNKAEVPDPERFGTMERMFEYVQDAIDRGAARIDADYDDVLGFPREVFIDYDEMMADEEQGFFISDVTPL